jgi:hypothetical protein
LDIVLTYRVTQSFPSGETSSDPIAILQGRYSALSDLHQEASTQLANKEIEINQLYARLTQATSAAEVTIAQLIKEKSDLERSLRWANEGRGAAEKAEKRAKEELRVYLEDHDTGVSLSPYFLLSFSPIRPESIQELLLTGSPTKCPAG